MSRSFPAAVGAMVLLLLLAAIVHTVAVLGGIPLPSDVLKSTASEPVAVPWEPMVGLWAGDAWHDSRPAAVAIGSGDGVVPQVTQAYGGDRWRPMSASHHAGIGRIDGDSLVVPFSGDLEARYRPLPDGRLFGRLEHHRQRNEVSYVIFERLPAESQARAAELSRTGRRPWRMVDIPMKDPDSGRSIALKATWYPPAVSGRAPLLLMTHGDVTPGYENLVLRYGELARLFASRGWSVLQVMRRGTGGSGGTLLPEFRPEGPPTVAYGDRRMAADIADLDAVLADAQGWANVDPARILLGGFSRGGLVALEYLAVHPNAAIGAINVSGGIWCEDVERAELQGRYTGDRLATAGATIRKPTWWLYGDNDHCQSVALTRQRFEGYRAAGGTGELHIYAGVPRDGHDLINRPNLWEADMLAILQSLLH